MSESKKANVLFIYPDQMRHDAMGNSGNSCVKTPGIDRLAVEGVAFEQAYTSFPLCCPFRASILTGKYAHNNGMYANHYPIDLNQAFLPELMNANGYKTGWIGKWHLSGGGKAAYVPKEYRCGFEHFVGFTRGHQYNTSVFYRNDDERPRKTTMYEPDYQTMQLYEFIDDALKEDQPFFAGICYGLPHPPLTMPDWYASLYAPEDIELPDFISEEDAPKAKAFMAKYYGLVTAVDVQISGILNYLDYKGISEDTMIIFVSDHGEMAGEHGKYGKRTYFDASMHVPMIIKYPKGFEGGKRVTELVDPSVDIFPTILDVCGIGVPDYAEGNSLMPVLKEEAHDQREFVYYELIKQPFSEFKEKVVPERGLRTKDYMYVAKDNVPDQLFALKEDTNELNNLIDHPDYAEVVKDFAQKLNEAMAISGDNWNVSFDYTIESFESHRAGNSVAADIFKTAICENKR